MRGSTGCEVQPLDDDEAPGDLILLEGGAHWSCRREDKAAIRGINQGPSAAQQPGLHSLDSAAALPPGSHAGSLLRRQLADS